MYTNERFRIYKLLAATMETFGVNGSKINALAKYEQDHVFAAVADFLYKHIGTPDIEIEVKLGVIRHLESSMRGEMLDEYKDRRDIDGETPLPRYFPTGVEGETFVSSSKLYFDTSVAKQDFELMNGLLIGLGRYLETKEQTGFEETGLVSTVDKFYRDPSGGSGRIRQTTNVDTREVSETIRKQRIDTITVSLPTMAYDLRISASLEEVCLEQVALLTKPTDMRKKNRYSYRRGDHIWDLTGVQNQQKSTPMDHDETTWEPEHYEMELELTGGGDVARARGEVLKASVAAKGGEISPEPVEEFLNAALPLYQSFRAFACATSGIEMQ